MKLFEWESFNINLPDSTFEGNIQIKFHLRIIFYLSEQFWKSKSDLRHPVNNVFDLAGRNFLFDQEIERVDWAEPEHEVDPDVMAKGIIHILRKQNFGHFGAFWHILAHFGTFWPFFL